MELKVVAKSYFQKLSIQKVTFKVVFKVLSSIQNLTSSYLDELMVVAKSYFQKSNFEATSSIHKLLNSRVGRKRENHWDRKKGINVSKVCTNAKKIAWYKSAIW